MVAIRVEKYLEVGGSKKQFSFACNLEDDSILGITGPSGCGKTSLLKILAKKYYAYEGSVLVNNTVELNAINTQHYWEISAYAQADDPVFH